MDIHILCRSVSEDSALTLPEMFVKRMKDWLGPEWPDFEHAMQQAASRGVRLHRVSMASTEGWPSEGLLALQHSPRPIPRELAALLGDPVPWCPGGYYLRQDSTLGRHVYHEMGLYYLQEPSAMAAVTALDPKPGERVLDLCAAPGGKTTGIAARMRGQGLLVANEIHKARVVTLAQNLERLGVDAVVTNETPDALATVWTSLFDAILVDAPCSGEGMFRKDPDAADEWDANAPEICARRQQDILAAAISMLKPGGRIVYSTCTFNPIENERLVEWALHHFDVTLDPLPVWEGWSMARPDWTQQGTDVSGARRLWPHLGRGEGHFVCRLIRDTQPTRKAVGASARGRSKKANAARLDAGAAKVWEAFLSSIVASPPEEWRVTVMQGGTAFRTPDYDLPTDGLRVLRPGLCLATLQHTRWEPHHHLAMSLAAEAAVFRLDLDLEKAAKYMAGEALPWSGPASWMWIHVDGFPVGWGKAVPGRVNNAYPKGLRKIGLRS